MSVGAGDRAFPFLTGFAVAFALLVEGLALPFPAILSPLLTPIIAVPVATVRVRNAGIAWLGPRYAAACCASALATWLPFVAIGSLPSFRLASPFPLSVLDAPGFLPFIVLEGGVAMWFAMLLQGWADPVRAGKWSRWHSKSWGAVGKVGGTLFIVSATSLVGIAVISELLRWVGSTFTAAFLLMIAVGITALIGFVALVIEATYGPTYEGIL